jgi:alkanesulfonate monooxygenase SsuD/methylene tetrahydromethanopterin reductase-like flavin-dependent oxidoreductase (luciferase family)
MKVYASIDDIHLPLAGVPAHARRAEALGYDGLIVPEAIHDGILYALLALEHTERITVTTGVVVAFARSPMLLAQDAWGLQALSRGRFELGLGEASSTTTARPMRSTACSPSSIRAPSITRRSRSCSAPSVRA